MKRISLFYFCYTIVSWSNLAVTTIMADEGTERKYLIRLWVPREGNYWINVIAQFAIVMGTLACISSHINLEFYIAGKVEFELEALSKMMENAETPQSSSKAFRYHADVLKLVSEINKLFSGQYVLEIILSSVQIGLRIYATINIIREGSPDLMLSIFTAVLGLIAPFSVCYLGNCIVTQGDNLQRSIYSNQWYKKTPKERNDLVVAQTMANKPITINYRKFIFFSYLEYLQLLQASYSYVMLTLAMID